MQVELQRATEAAQATLRNLFQLYQYDLSVIYQWSPDAYGRFDQADLDARLVQGNDQWFVILAADLPAGFALIDRRSRMHAAFEGWAIAEFFVLRGMRRQGVGSAAARQLFDRFPGAWEVATPASNTVATAFWRAVADRYTAGAYQEIWFQRNGWRGNIERFISPPGAM
jgi:predicted acetyltransferase